MIEIIAIPIDIAGVIRSVDDPSAGGIDIFVGTTRNRSGGKQVVALEYEAYRPMALKMMHRIAHEAGAKWQITKLSIVHRLGRLDVGEASIAIAVSSAHRNEAFEACRFVIDAVKKEVPIWKKELFDDGEIWVGHQSESPPRV